MVTTWRPFFCSRSLQWPLLLVDFKVQAQHYNLSIAKKEALTWISKCGDMVIKPVDKGGAVVVWSRLLYIAEANPQLPMADSVSIWIMILLRKVRTWLNQQYLKWLQTTSIHHQHHHDSACICFLRSIKQATLVDQIIVSACCCPNRKHSFLLGSDYLSPCAPM